MFSRKGCWTCKDRKVSCDKARPTCSNCSRSKRTCGGYGYRLSWPQQRSKEKTSGDKAFAAKTQNRSVQEIPTQWVNVTFVDVHLHLVSAHTDTQAYSHLSRKDLSLPNYLEVTSALPEIMEEGDLELLQYFKSVLSDIIPHFGCDRRRMCHLLLRMALNSRSSSSKAVLLSLLALSAYHRRGDSDHARRLKHAALQALIGATDSQMGANSSIEHIAAGLVLCVTEMQSIDTVYDWVGHICGVREVMRGLQEDHDPNSDASIILGWAYHFDVLLRFSLRHWRTDVIKATALELGFRADTKSCALQYVITRLSFTRELPSISTHSHPLLQLLAKVIELIPSDPEFNTSQYQQSLDNLSTELQGLSLTLVNGEQSRKDLDLLEVFRLAALIYLERVPRNFSGQSARLHTWYGKALSILDRLAICPSPFALFILGCEAHEDNDRLIFLNFFTRIEQAPYLRNLLEVKGLIQTAWIQHDLRAGGELDYIHKVNLVLSSRNNAPNFV